jgi:hypothetical protein
MHTSRLFVLRTRANEASPVATALGKRYSRSSSVRAAPIPALQATANASCLAPLAHITSSPERAQLQSPHRVTPVLSAQLHVTARLRFVSNALCQQCISLAAAVAAAQCCALLVQCCVLTECAPTAQLCAGAAMPFTSYPWQENASVGAHLAHIWTL